MDISWWANGYSGGHSSSFHRLCGGGMFQCSGLNLSQPLGEVPPRVPTEPVRTCSSQRQRATCQPPRLPDPAERQVWEAKRDPASAIPRATASMRSAGTPDSSAANSSV